MSVNPKGKTFFARLVKGHIFKVLVDVLAESLQKCPIFLGKDGISVNVMDTSKIKLFDTIFKRKNLGRNYTCKKERTIYVNVHHLQKLLKSVKKKDSIVMFLDPVKPNKLGVSIIPGGDTKTKRIETNYIVIQSYEDENDDIKPEKIDPPEGGYKYPVVIEGSDFQKIRKLFSIGKKLSLKIQGSKYLSFYCDGGDIYSTELEFGDLPSDNDEEEEEDDDNLLYDKQFKCTVFNSIIKIGTLGAPLSFYAPSEEGHPIRIEVTTVLSKINIYLKDDSIVEYEKANKQEEEEVIQVRKKGNTRRKAKK